MCSLNIFSLPKLLSHFYVFSLFNTRHTGSPIFFRVKKREVIRNLLSTTQIFYLLLVPFSLLSQPVFSFKSTFLSLSRESIFLFYFLHFNTNHKHNNLSTLQTITSRFNRHPFLQRFRSHLF